MPKIIDFEPSEDNYLGEDIESLNNFLKNNLTKAEVEHVYIKQFKNKASNLIIKFKDSSKLTISLTPENNWFQRHETLISIRKKNKDTYAYVTKSKESIWHLFVYVYNKITYRIRYFFYR